MPCGVRAMKKNIKKFTELKSVGIETAGSSRMV
jgi:hypothetical protein